MTKEIVVRFVPTMISERDVKDRCVVMADILRASTTMINALANGIEVIFPQAEIDESRKLAAELGKDALIGGERNGKIVDGFDCGNSPLEYTPEVVSGKSLVLCTTNGTFTLDYCRPASHILIGGFVNLSRVVDELLNHDYVTIACAGTNRMVTDEDVLFAGAVAHRIQELVPDLQLCDSAKVAISRWESVINQTEHDALYQAMAKSHGGRNLMKLEYDHDVRFCSNIDTVPVLPILDLQTWTIRAQRTRVNMDSN